MAETVLHVELHRFPHSARAFNLSAEEVRATIASPWEAGRLIELGERFWTPGECRLTIFEGPRIEAGELGLGRGWAVARRRGRDVTDVLIRAPAAADPHRIATGPSFADFKHEVLGLAVREAPPLALLWRLAAQRHPDRPLSECLGLVERAVTELVGDALAEPLDADALRAWESWSVTAGARLRATARGERAYRRG
jgi:hypothetical protein